MGGGVILEEIWSCIWIYLDLDLCLDLQLHLHPDSNTLFIDVRDANSIELKNEHVKQKMMNGLKTIQHIYEVLVTNALHYYITSGD